MKYLYVLAGAFFLQPFNLDAQSAVPDDYELVYHQSFDAPQSIYDFEMTDPSAWRIEESGDQKTLELYGKSNYESKVRSPFNIALLRRPIVGDFVLETRLAQSGREYGHRDLCLFFGFQDPTNFYYVHMATKADDNANNIFLVNDEPRTNIAEKTTSGTDWGATNSWHTVRVVRNVTSGKVQIFFDDMSTPIMETTDTHFAEGRIGFGSFDDTGRFDDIKIWAPQGSVKQKSIFKKANQKSNKREE